MNVKKMEQKTTGHIYTISNLTREIKSLLEEAFSFVWVTGEISNFSTPASGHSYFTLKDPSAVISSVMFKNQKRNLKFKPENGMKVFGLARISLYEPRGAYQLIFEHLEPDGTGSLQIAFEQLKNKLAVDGLFEQKHKKSIPFISSKVCIITSPTGAVVRDIINVAQRRFPNCCLEILPVKVQGVGSEDQICEAIGFANKQRLPDLIILARGGGSLEDFASFNSERVARSVFNSTIPVITGVGHETDFTIADFVADLRAPTPSAAAELAFPDKFGLNLMVSKFKKQIQLAMSHKFMHKKDVLVQFKSRLKTPMSMVFNSRLKLEDDQTRLSNAMAHYLQFNREKLLRFSDALDAKLPKSKVSDLRQQVDLLTQTLNHTFSMKVQANKTAQIELHTKLNALSPKAVLKRGYSISRTLSDKKVITKSDDVTYNEKIQVILYQGELTANVEKINGQKKNI